MAFVDAKNVHGEIQTVPEHYLEAFPDQFQPVDSEESPAAEVPALKPSPSAKAANPKES